MPVFRAVNSSPQLAKACVVASGALMAYETYEAWDDYSQEKITGSEFAGKVGLGVATSLVPGMAALKAPAHAAKISMGAVAVQTAAEAARTDGFQNEDGQAAMKNVSMDVAAAVIDSVSHGSSGAAVVAMVRIQEIARKQGTDGEAMLRFIRAHSNAAMIAASGDDETFGERLMRQIDHIEGHF